MSTYFHIRIFKNIFRIKTPAPLLIIAFIFCSTLSFAQEVVPESAQKMQYTVRAEIVNNTYRVYSFQSAIIVDGIPVFVCTVDLTNVNIVQGEVASYEINFLATEVNLFNTYLNNKLLTQLAFTAGATVGLPKDDHSED